MHKLPVGAYGTPSNWATWWILDGGDDAASLRAADAKGSLNQAVQVKPVLSPPPPPPHRKGNGGGFFGFKPGLVLELVETRICLQPGEYTPVRPITTGDGKAMLAANFLEGGTMEFSLGRGKHQENSFGSNAAGCATDPRVIGRRG